jgi:hypothetical protein
MVINNISCLFLLNGNKNGNELICIKYSQIKVRKISSILGICVYFYVPLVVILGIAVYVIFRVFVDDCAFLYLTSVS